MKKWCIQTIIIIITLLLIFSTIIIVVDPYFHYHKPLFAHIINDDRERHQNYGIVKHFEYDAIITGTSMSKNFKTSEFDQIFDVNSIKVPFPGNGYKEPNDMLKVAFKNNTNIKYVVRSIDIYSLASKENVVYENAAELNYLNNNIIFDDVKYIFNKDSMVDVLKSIDYSKNEKSINFDKYSNFNNSYTFSKEAVVSRYKDSLKQSNYNSKYNKQKRNEKFNVTYDKVSKNVNKNMVSTIKENPNTTFLLFFPPYNMALWGGYVKNGTLDYYIKLQKIAADILLQYDNVKLYGWGDNMELVTNYDIYMDVIHYNEDTNSNMLKWFKEEKGLLTNENKDKYFAKISELYKNYDYDNILK